MDNNFLEHILAKQSRVEAIPSNDVIAQWASNVISLLYPVQAKNALSSLSEVKTEFENRESELTEILRATQACITCDCRFVSEQFFKQVPELYRVLNTDIAAIFEGDPAAQSEFEVIKTYPGFLAIAFYRVAHLLLLLQVPLLPRLLTEYAHSKTGIDIHPAAQIDESLFIDHGTGIVIGETAIIGKHVKLYQGVTLGALSVSKALANIKRHPTVEDNVIIYSGATILGGQTVIGQGSIIGGNVWLTKSVPAQSSVYHLPSIKVVNLNTSDTL